jgi:hypothetical protein
VTSIREQVQTYTLPFLFCGEYKYADISQLYEFFHNMSIVFTNHKYSRPSMLEFIKLKRICFQLKLDTHLSMI